MRLFIVSGRYQNYQNGAVSIISWPKEEGGGGVIESGGDSESIDVWHRECTVLCTHNILMLRMRSSLVVRASDCQCTSCKSPEFYPSIRRHSGIWGAADEAVLNIVRKQIKKIPKNSPVKNIILLSLQRKIVQIRLILNFSMTLSGLEYMVIMRPQLFRISPLQMSGRSKKAL